jgi:Uncharacterized protein conserved in bacteria (DUF2312)
MAKPATMTNQYDKTILNSLLNKIDGFHADLASESGTYMQKCRNIRESIQGVFEEAKAAGIPQKELRTWIKIRQNEAKNAKLYDELEPDQQHNLQMIAEATEKVRDLPLWKHSFDEDHGTKTDDTGAMKHAKPMFN